jgi:4-hydroxy-3-methylbut-2-en-1-yl diphosphate synthase IspG/GcpE
MGTEIFHLGLSEALSLNPVQFIQKILLEKNPIENNDGTTETLTVITESANSRQWIDDLIKAKNENIALIINSTDFDELSMALGIALTGTRIVAVICLNHNALECYIQTAKALGVIFFGVNVISCPTCGRCHQELESIVKAVKEGTSHIKTPLTIAIMGCEVNGPGEAKHADIGIASSKTGSILFKRGKKIKVLDRQNAAKTLIAEAEKMCNR